MNGSCPNNALQRESVPQNWTAAPPPVECPYTPTRDGSSELKNGLWELLFCSSIKSNAKPISPAHWSASLCAAISYSSSGAPLGKADGLLGARVPSSKTVTTAPY